MIEYKNVTLGVIRLFYTQRNLRPVEIAHLAFHTSIYIYIICLSNYNNNKIKCSMLEYRFSFIK